jgi:ABC-type phosphate transport system substrate-binding protein
MRKPLKIILLLLLMLLLKGNACLASEVILVVHKDNRLTGITRRAAELIFLSRKTEWNQGEHIHVVVNNDPEVYGAFCRDILLKSPLQYLIYRKKMLFTGSGIPPLTMSSDAEVKAFIAATNDSIGFIRRDSLDSRVKELIVQ